MTIPLEKLKARLLANPEVKAEYDALAPEFRATTLTPARPPPRGSSRSRASAGRA